MHHRFTYFLCSFGDPQDSYRNLSVKAEIPKKNPGIPGTLAVHTLNNSNSRAHSRSWTTSGFSTCNRTSACLCLCTG